MFKITGNLRGYPVELEYKKGLLRNKLLGDDLAIIEVEARIKSHKIEGRTVGPVGMHIKPSLQDPLAALSIILEVLDPEPAPQLTGDIPEPPEVPPGAII